MSAAISGALGPSGSDPVDRLRQPRAVAQARGVQLAAAMHLLGDVGKVEVGGERAHQPRRGHRVEIRQQPGGRRAVCADRAPDGLDEIDQRRSFLADQRLPQQHAELVDVAPQIGPLVGSVSAFCAG